MTDLCLKYGISRKKRPINWYHRFLEDGIEGLQDQSRAPHNATSLKDQLIEGAIDYKLKHRKWALKENF